MMMTAAAVVIIIVILTHFFFLNALLQMHFCMSFLFIGSGKFSSACVALEGFLSSMGSVLNLTINNFVIILNFLNLPYMRS
jgi:hypothetical protein